MGERTTNIQDIVYAIEAAKTLLPLIDLDNVATSLDTARAVIHAVGSETDMFDKALYALHIARVRVGAAQIALLNGHTHLHDYVAYIRGDTYDDVPAQPTIAPYTETHYSAERVIPPARRERAQQVAAQLNNAYSGKALPQVTLAPKKLDTKGIIIGHNWTILHDGKPVGYCIVQQDHTQKTYSIFSMELAKEHIGMGLGMATLKNIIIDALLSGYSVCTGDGTLTAQSKKLWERIAECGSARTMRPIEATNPSNRFFKGYMVVDSAEALQLQANAAGNLGDIEQPQ
jgi:hypothetical protein